MTEQVLALGTEKNLLKEVKKRLRAYGIDLVENLLSDTIFKEIAGSCYPVTLVDVSFSDIETEAVINRLREASPMIQVILLTGEKQKDSAEKAFREKRIFDYYIKPIPDIDKLIRTILRAFDLWRANINAATQNSPLAEIIYRNHGTANLSQTRISSIPTTSGKYLSRASMPVLKSVFDSINSPLIILDTEMRIIALNRAALSYFNLEKNSNILESPCYLRLRARTEPCSGCTISEVMKTGKPSCLQKRCLEKMNRWEEIYIYPILHRTETIGALVQINDVTYVKEIETRFTQTEKLASLGLLASSIAHEINGPNNLITFNIPILRDYLSELLPAIEIYMRENDEIYVMGRPYSEIKRDIFTILDSIQHGSERIKIIVSELSRFIRERDEKWVRPLSIEEVINRALVICGNKIRRSVKHFEITVEKNPPLIEANGGDLEQILINLLVNAAQSIDKQDSWIKLNVKTLSDGSKQELCIEIADNGCGIEGEMLDRIFEPFFTTKPVGQGTGLGLSICKTLTEHLGGRIEVKSEPGKGSTFTLILPVKHSGAKLR